MSLPINPALARAAYVPQSRPTAAPGAPAAPAPTPASTAPAASRAADGLSASEQAMIDRYFPASPAMALRLYGPAGQAQTVTPPALGTRLDVRG